MTASSTLAAQPTVGEDQEITPAFWPRDLQDGETSADRVQDHPVVTKDGTNFLVAWREPATRMRPDDRPSVFLARINEDGVNLDPDGQNLGLDNDDGPISMELGRGVLLMRAGTEARTWSPDGSLSPVVSLMGAGHVSFDGSAFFIPITAARDVEVERITASLRVSRVRGVASGVDEIAVASTGSGRCVYARHRPRRTPPRVSRSRHRFIGLDDRGRRAALPSRGGI